MDSNTRKQLFTFLEKELALEAEVDEFSVEDASVEWPDCAPRTVRERLAILERKGVLTSRVLFSGKRVYKYVRPKDK